MLCCIATFHIEVLQLSVIGFMLIYLIVIPWLTEILLIYTTAALGLAAVGLWVYNISAKCQYSRGINDIYICVCVLDKVLPRVLYGKYSTKRVGERQI